MTERRVPVDENPFQPPPSGERERPRAELEPEAPVTPPVRPLAVLVGAVTDNFATLVFVYLYAFIMAVRIGESGFEHEIERTLRSLPHQLTLYVAGGAMSVLGGLVAGVIAGRNELWHGLAAGLLSSLIGKAIGSSDTAAPTSGAEVWMAALATPLTIASAGLGGFLAARRRRALDAQA